MTSNALISNTVQTISVVGNGPISQIDAMEIDKADVILRFNGARSCGAAGQRVDILLLNRARVYTSRRINPIALHRAKEVWVNDIKENGEVDWYFEKECIPHYIGHGPISKARVRLETYDPWLKSNPTTGASILAELLESYPDIEIHLFGFSHQGKQHTHDWDAERKWVHDLTVRGLIQNHRSSGTQARRSFSGHLEFFARLLEKRTKYYLYNRVLNSKGSMKKRIFGEAG